jgi:hypothetical protein
VAKAVLSDGDDAGGSAGGATVTQRWLARLAPVAGAAAVLVTPLVAGLRQSVAWCWSGWPA